MARLTDAQLHELKERNPCEAVAVQWVTLRRGGKLGQCGPCPMCSIDRNSRTDGRFEVNADGWVCAVCSDGGDVISLVMKAEGIDFPAAVERLGGPVVGLDIESDEAKRRAAAHAEKKRQQDIASAKYREKERGTVHEIWRRGAPIAGTPVEAYLASRHLLLPAGAHVRALDEVPMYASGAKDAGVVYRGPAMLAAIIGPEHNFAALHTTYLKADGALGKAEVLDPETNEPLPAKKVRGSKAGGRIELLRCRSPRVLIMGEGIETVLSVWRAWCAGGRSLDGVAIWASVDLGNLGGRALESVRHPSKRSAKGRPTSVPGPVPDLTSLAIPIPESVEDLLLLGDGDSDYFLTANALVRAGSRYAKPGRLVRAAFAPGPDAFPPNGADFNNMAPDWPRIMALVDAAVPATLEALLPAAPPAKPANSAADETNVVALQRHGRTSSLPPPDPAEADPQPSQDFPDPQDAGADDGNIVAFPHFAVPSPGPPGEDNADVGATLAGEIGITEAQLIEGSKLDHSDMGNARRLEIYLGQDLTCMAQDGLATGELLAWSTRHWDREGGTAAAVLLAGRVGNLIKAEADVMTASPLELRAIETGDDARNELAKVDTADQRAATKTRRRQLEALVVAADEARDALRSRKISRRKWGVASRNIGRIQAMINLLAPKLRRPPDDFNRDAMLVVTRSHTLRFTKSVPAVAGGVAAAEVTALSAHDRADLITAMIPHDFDRSARCPKWLANMERFQPDPLQRRTVQQFTGLGLLGVPLQKVMYHYGTGGNFKSVFLEVVTRVLGDSFAIGLPAESVSGREERNAGQASPDLARVFGKRMLRVLEMPDGQPLQQGTIKKLTGGEKWPVRTLFKGYFEFQPRAKTHMSGNSMPTFDGGDGGMRRRLIIVEWPVKIAEAEQRDFEEVVSELVAEAPGILNWLIDGALDFLRSGLFIAPEIAKLTLEHADEMDPIGQFFRECVVPDPDGVGVPARAMYEAYSRWSAASARRTRSETKFGREMHKHCQREDGRVRRWLNVKLEGVPDAEPDRKDRPPAPSGTQSYGVRDDDHVE